jgi:hypothetical protein
MKAKLATPIAVLFMFMQMATSAGPQRISSFTGLAKGEGTLTVADENYKITGVWVNLKQNGEAEITLYTNVQLFVKGQWSASDNRINEIALKITGGIVDGNATGAGTLFLRSDGKSIDELSFQVRSTGNKRVAVKFVADKKESSQ